MCTSSCRDRCELPRCPMRSAKAKCMKCGWRAMAHTEGDVVAMAKEHQQAVAHTVRIMTPEGWFGWTSRDMYPLPELTERERTALERMAESWNPSGRYNGD